MTKESEKKCLIESHAFIVEATKALNMTWNKIYPDMEGGSTAAMLGRIAADKYQACVEGAAVGNQAPQPKATHKAR